MIILHVFRAAAGFLAPACIFAGCAIHGSAEITPITRDSSLEFIEQSCFSELVSHILPEGLVVYSRPDPCTLRDLYRRGAIQADGAYFNGYLLAALSLKYAVTRDETVRGLAFAAWSAHHRLVAESGYPGLVARSFGKKDPSDANCVFRRDGSGDGLCGWLFGAGVFARLAADPARRAEAALDLREIVRHMARHDLRIHVSENEPAPYGDFGTPVLAVSIGHRAAAMEALASLALRLNPADPECLRFRRLLDERGYPAQFAAFHSWFPHHADNSMMYAMNLVTAVWNQENADYRARYLEGAEEFWERVHDWQMAFYGLAYKFAGGRARPESIRDSIDRLANLPVRHLARKGENRMVKARMRIVPIERRPSTSSHWAQNVWLELAPGLREPAGAATCRLDFLLAYWLGRYMGEYAPSLTGD